jgi:hypothetical protein
MIRARVRNGLITVFGATAGIVLWLDVAITTSLMEVRSDKSNQKVAP